MKRSFLTLFFYLSLVFASGLLVGALGYRLYTTESSTKATAQEDSRPSPEEWRARYVASMKERLELSAEQLVQLNTILDEVKAQYKALEKEAHEAYRPQRKEIRDQQIAKTMAMLTPEQQVEYQKYLDERAERRRKRTEAEKR